MTLQADAELVGRLAELLGGRPSQPAEDHAGLIGACSRALVIARARAARASSSRQLVEACCWLADELQAALAVLLGSWSKVGSGERLIGAWGFRVRRRPYR